MTAAAVERQLTLELVCSCVVVIRRREHDEHFVIAAVNRAPSCSLHTSWPSQGAEVVGFGPYPDWNADVAIRVRSLPEAGGVMEGEHAFILDEQFAFLAGDPAPRPFGPIRDAKWKAR